MNEQMNDTTNEISLIDLYYIIKKNILLILFFTITVFILATVYAYSLSPKYKSTADVMVQVQTNPDSETYDYINAQRLVATISELFTRDVILTEVATNLDYEVNASQIRSNLSVSSSQTSFFINISYISEDKVFAKEVVNEVISVAITMANDGVSFPSLNERIIRTSFAQDGRYDSPNRPLYMVIGIILGGIVGVGITFIKELFKNTYQTKEQLEQAFNIQVLGVIPLFDGKKEDKK